MKIHPDKLPNNFRPYDSAIINRILASLRTVSDTIFTADMDAKINSGYASTWNPIGLLDTFTVITFVEDDVAALENGQLREIAEVTICLLRGEMIIASLRY